MRAVSEAMSLAVSRLLSYCSFSISISSSWCFLMKLISSSSLRIAWAVDCYSSCVLASSLCSRALFSFLRASKIVSLFYSSACRLSVTCSSSRMLSYMFASSFSCCCFWLSSSVAYLDSCWVTYSWNWSKRAENLRFRSSLVLLSSFTLSLSMSFSSFMVYACTLSDWHEVSRLLTS